VVKVELEVMVLQTQQTAHRVVVTVTVMVELADPV
jgi:hypothetical protein